MKFSIYAAIASLVSGQELFMPVTDKVADNSCAFKFKACTSPDISAYWKMDVANTTCKNPTVKKGDHVEIQLAG